MAEILRVHGNTETSEQIGRDVLWIAVTATNAILDTVISAGGSETSLDQIRKVIDRAGSITLIGTNSTTAVMFMVEGMGVNDGVNDPMTLQLELNELETQLEALVPDLGEVIVTSNRILGVAYDIVLTSTN